MATATGLVLTVAQTLFAALDCKELRNLCSMFGYESDLEGLQSTAETIKAVLLDIDSKHDTVLGHKTKIWVDRLKDAVYEVDDLVDEFNTIVQRNQLEDQTDGVKLFKKLGRKVRRFFSPSNKLVVAFNTSLDIKNIRDKLDAIARDHKNFGFSVDYEPIRRVRKETSSYVDKDRILGRDGDKDAVVGLLLQDHDSSSTLDPNISFVTIVGMGGLGKTALAQLVYDDDRITKQFDLRLWVCVSEEFGLKHIISKMLKSISDQNWDHLGTDQQQTKVRDEIKGKRYLLVLDDVWCESHNDWDELSGFLKCGGMGSRILVTTRSNLVSKAVGSYPVYSLKGLSPKDSWDLFAYMAFVNGGEQADAELIKIGREIVKKCANVPLALKVTGSMLYGQDSRKWHSFKEINLSEMRKTSQNEDDTMTILRFSYNHLTPSLKSCFGYCALFPKDYVIAKDVLINLWSAHGCLEPQSKDQRVEDVGEEYFSILLNRCLFQDIETYRLGDVVTCKMHDLVHDLAQQVVGGEMLQWSGGHFKDKLRHLSISSSWPDDLFNRVKTCKLRTFLTLYPYQLGLSNNASILKQFVSNCRHLKVLHLSNLRVKKLPSTIGDVVHLRYLDLSRNIDLEMLPESVTKLYNLHVLILEECYKLMELPKGLCKLVNLRVLDIYRCFKLSHMPKGMGNLTGLERLSAFVVGMINSEKMSMSHLDQLGNLVQLGGYLNIKVGQYVQEVPPKVLIKSRLQRLKIAFDDSITDEDAQMVLERLQPNHDLVDIRIDGYRASNLPSWASLGSTLRTYLPSLVAIYLMRLHNLRSLPLMRELEHLKILYLYDIGNVEYMEESVEEASSSSSNEVTFFPCLKQLDLIKMGNLKGWWRPDKNGDKNEATFSFSRFSCLQKLKIESCPNMISLGPYPLLQYKYAFQDGYLMELNSGSEHKALVADKIGGYKNFNEEELGDGLASIKLYWSREESVASGIEAIQFLKICGSSLRHLVIKYCGSMKRVGKGVFEHLPNLHKLDIRYCDSLSLEEEEEEGMMMSWKSLKNLSSLVLWDLQKMVKLPKGIQYLTSLHSLDIWYCNNLGSLPEWISCLSSLQHLTLNRCNGLKSLPEEIRDMPSLTHLSIRYCHRLTSRCRALNGEDSYLITHIPNLQVEPKE